MKHRRHLAALFMAGMLFCSGAALADKPAWAGGGQPGKNGGADSGRRDSQPPPGVQHFNDDSRRIIFDYYGTQARKGKCPPGLAKKNNGCLPPGQAKKWQRGYPLPTDLRYHSLPHDILLRLPPPPAQHRYVQVAGDILLIAIGTSMVVDAVEDILR